MSEKMILSPEAAEARREYRRQWNAANPDKVRKHQTTYWERKAREAAAKNSNV